jgi:ferredoxin
MICLVQVAGRRGFVPACATPVEEGMQVLNETEEVHAIRRTGLELLLSDHVGDCLAPCQNTCPAHMDIPLMLRQVAAGELREAIATVKADIALPAVLGRVCPELCEKGCRRGDLDHPASICLVKRYVADVDLASESPYVPPREPASGRSVAIVGSGPTGLAAAYHLLQDGHACTLFDEHDEPGGVLRQRFDEEQLPRHVLDGEIDIIRAMGAQFVMNHHVQGEAALADLQESFDALLIAIGPLAEAHAERLGIESPDGKLRVNTRTYETNVPGVFVAGDGLKQDELIIRSVAAGKAAAYCVDQYLSGVAVTGLPRAYTVRAGRLCDAETQAMAFDASRADRTIPTGGPRAGLTAEEARAEALRCLRCNCSAADGCKLRRYVDQYGASATRFRGDRRPLERHIQHADIVYEPGKCILCGLCIQIAEDAKEPLGLSFIGRGFDIRVGVPFDRTIDEGLRLVGRRCAEACPTGAISIRAAGLGLCATCGLCPDETVPADSDASS